MRTRLCDNPPPQLGGKDCTANGSSATDIRRCNEDPCPSTYRGALIHNDNYHGCALMLLPIKMLNPAQVARYFSAFIIGNNKLLN